MRKLNLCAKGLLSLTLALAVLLTSAAPVLGAETVSDKASTIQLMKTEGDVSVANGSGRNLSVRADMRLYNGYHTKTKEKSYAWVNLDSSKLIKLDEVSEAEVRKSGKKLEVLLDSGNLYFDVSEPLDQTENLSIRTSTMIVGIRGTCGWVKMLDAWHAQVYLLEGRVECGVTDPVTGESRTTVLQGGETAEFVVYPEGRTGERCDIIRQTYSEERIDGFVLVELVEDRPLCEKIYADSKLDILGHFNEDSAQSRLEADQASMGEKLNQTEKAQSTQDNRVSQDPVWDSGSKDSGDSDSSSSGGDSGTVSEPSAVTLTMPVTDMAVQQALNRPATRQVIVAPGTASAALDVGINMTVDRGKTLTLNSGVPVRVQGSLTVNGTVDAGDNLTNDGTVTVNSANTLRVRGNLTNNNTMTVTATGRSITEGTFTNNAALALTEGAQVLAKRFALAAPVEGWSVTELQSDGYYHLAADSTPEPEPEPEPGVTAGAFTVSGGAQDTDFSYADGVLTILTDTALTIKNTDPSTATTDRILVTKDQAANLTLAGVNIGTSDAAAFEIPMNSKGDVTITLASGTENTLISDGNYAGLSKHVRNDTSSGHSTPTAAQMGGTLTIQGSGKLTAQSAGGAGIGGGSIRTAGFINVCSTANIAITGGTIIATGGANSAGIGGGSASDAFNIFISGTADVTATGGSSGGAGIGGGYESHGGSVSGVPGIVIAGGKVTATGGDFGGAGIGGGYRGNSGKIEITGGTITAAGKDRAAGIGGGTKYDGAFGAGVNGGEATVIISGGAITATGGSNGGPGIGSGGCSNTYSGSATVNISGSAVVTATGGGGAPGIGCGIGTSATNNASGHITISDSADVTGNVSVNRGSFTISGGEVKSSDGNTVTAADGVTLNLTGGTITCDASNYSALSLGNTKDFPDECKTVIRGKDFAMQSLPNGYANNLHDDDKYYYLEPSAAAGDFTVIGGTLDTDYSYADGVLTVKTTTPLTISSTENTQDTIVVAKDVDADITLAGVNINVDDKNYSWDAANKKIAFQVEKDSSGRVKVTLASGTANFLTSGAGHSGLEMDSSTGTLTIEGPGALTAQGGVGSGTGIGGSYEGKGNCTIIINGGDITAIGASPSRNGGKQGFGGAGIGTSMGNARVTINGGNITAYGGKINVVGSDYSCVGIGASTGTAGTVTINGGTVNAFGTVGIGNRDDYFINSTATVTITGGTVNATGTQLGIGRRDDDNNNASSNITISGDANVTASTDNASGPAIGGTNAAITVTGTPTVRGNRENLVSSVPDGYAVRGPADDGYYHLVYAPTGDFTVTGGTQDSDYSYADGALTILTDKALTIRNIDPDTPTTDCIVVDGGVNANVTLAGVNINVSGTGKAGSSSEAGELGQAAFKAGSGGTVTVTLTGTNTLLGGHGRAGLETGETADSTLIVQGSGALTATGGGIYQSFYGSGAGIGASYGNGPGNIVIAGGTITASSTGMTTSVGIGSNTLPEDSANSVQITGGTITGGPSSTDRSVITKQLTMSGGTVNGDIAASSFNMSAGKVNGRVLAVRSSFTISGGEIASSDRRTVEAASDLESVPITVNLNGGTITNNSNGAAGDCSAILIGQYTTITGAIETDIRSKSGETLIVCSNSPTDYTPYTPDGYAVSTLQSDGYYHLVPWTKTTLSSDGLTAAAIQNELDKADVDEVYISGSGPVTLDRELTIPGGKVLSLSDTVNLTVSDSASLVNNGTIDLNSRSLTVNGTLTNSGVIKNCYNLALTAPGSKLVMLDGEISGMGATTWMISVANSPSLILTGGTITYEGSSGYLIGALFETDTILPDNLGTPNATVFRSLARSLLGNDMANVTETMGYQAELREDGYYYLVKKEENP